MVEVIRPERYYWLRITDERGVKQVDIGLPYFDEHGYLAHWDCCLAGRVLTGGRYEVEALAMVPVPPVVEDAREHGI